MAVRKTQVRRKRANTNNRRQAGGAIPVGAILKGLAPVIAPVVGSLLGFGTKKLLNRKKGNGLRLAGRR